MSASLKPATPKAWALLEKLEALAARGIDGERLSAEHKLARLKARYDFGGTRASGAADARDLFTGAFVRARKARKIYTFNPTESDIANFVKWALESATKIPCLFRGNALLIEGTVPTANQMRKIADYLACTFRTLVAKFSSLEGLTLSDRAAFVMGLYDGMMNEVRSEGQRLPSRGPVSPKAKRTKRDAGTPASAATLHVHPYTLAVGLGKQIRFSTSVDDIAAELEVVLKKQLGS